VAILARLGRADSTAPATTARIGVTATGGTVSVEVTQAQQFEQIIVEQVDAVLKITLNRPERMKRVDPTMMSEMVAAVTAANDDPSIGAIVVTGAGRGFCAGADIQAVFEAGIENDHQERTRPGSSPTDWVRMCRESKPMIAAINGASIGVGLTMVLPFDQIVAAKGRQALGAVRQDGPGARARLVALPRRPLRLGAASWLALSGATVLAEEGKELGLVDRVVEPTPCSRRRWRWLRGWPGTRRRSCA
jgi:2-(1,2-epoxy-1,2-dihydrophenyl)acetyl-CoA isomerase